VVSLSSSPTLVTLSCGHSVYNDDLSAAENRDSR
jgi:hypothetical protein